MMRFLRWAIAILVALVVIVVLAFRLSPWPSVAIIEYAFSKGDAASEARLAKHVPPGVTSRLDISYGSGFDERLDVYRMEGVTGPQRAVVWVHGGGWIGGSKAGVANYAKVIAGHGYTTITVEYSTGFGSVYPKPVEQVNAALGYISTHAAELNIDPSVLVLAGDSAGSQLSAQVAILTTDPAYAAKLGIAPLLRADQLAGVVLASGAYDLESINLDGDFGWFLRTVLWAYSGSRDFMADPRFRLLSVTEHVTAAFPPAFITSGNGDPLVPQAVRFAEVLSGLGGEADTLFFPAERTPPLGHEYQFNLDDPAGAEAMDRMLAFLGKVFAPRPAMP